MEAANTHKRPSTGFADADRPLRQKTRLLAEQHENSRILIGELRATIKSLVSEMDHWSFENSKLVERSHQHVGRSRKLLDRIYERELVEAERRRFIDEQQKFAWLIRAEPASLAFAPAPPKPRPRLRAGRCRRRA